MRYRYGPPRGRSNGQVLFLAVLVMMLILLVGGVFVATVVFSQTNAQTDTDRSAAQTLADAGVRFADRMLLTSPEGADWRPLAPPYALDTDGDPLTPGPYDMTTDPTLLNADGRGTPYYTDIEMTRGWFAIRDGLGPTPGAYFRIGFSKYPDPRDPVDPGPDGLPGTADDYGDAPTFGDGTVLLRLTYAPVTTPDLATPQVRWSGGPMAKCIKIEAIGRMDSEGGRPIWHRVVAYKPLGITDYARFITDRDATGDPAKLFIHPFIDYDDDGTVEPPEVVRSRIEGGVLSNTRLTLVGDNDGTATNQILLHSRRDPGPDRIPGNADDTMASVDDQAVRATEIALEYVTDPPAAASHTDVYVDPQPLDPAVGSVSASTSPTFNTLNGRVLDDRKTADATGIVRRSGRLEPPDLDRQNPETGASRYVALTRDSGTYVAMASGSLENDGTWGYGAGVFIDNETDIQFGHDLEALEADWLRAGPTTGESGWSPSFTVYRPPAVRITLYPTEASITGGDPTRIASDPAAALADGSLIYWPRHTSGAPGMRLERRDIARATGKQRTWRYHQQDDGPDGTAGTPDDRFPGDDTRLHVMYLDYPRSGVIAALGNVRVEGVLPPKPDGTGVDLSTRPDGSWRDYNLTIHSGGTIYVDGQLIKPSTAVRLDPTLPGSNPAFVPVNPDPATNPLYFDYYYYDSHVALLAADCVCLNTTQIVPHRFARPANEVQEDPLNPAAGGHFALPNVKDALVHTSAAIPRTNGGLVSIVAKHAGQEPGSSYVALSVNANLYDFAGGAGQFVFSFAPAGPTPEGATLSWALSPSYDYLARAWPWIPTLSVGPLAWNNIAFMPPATVPAVGDEVPGGARDYWLRKFKIAEYVDANSDGTPEEPIGALDIHVDALIYAQRGSWFVIPGEFFEPDTRPQLIDLNGDGTPEPVGGDLDRNSDGTPDIDANGDGSQTAADFEFYARAFKRYNYRITVSGAISENRPARPEAVRDWTDKWSFPDGAGGWGQMVYEFDDTLRRARDNPDTTGTPQSNLCSLPALPVSPDVLFVDR